ncbi:hypothetical protein IAD21_01557 [Abditibacteriota bacterium]|nr:hypothetical protein IAD21_01557 [Abditibacteriota bacterium]
MKSDSENKRVEGDLKNGLKGIRARLGLSQNELAQRAGVARQTIGGIEAALYAPSAAVALRLARALGCRVEDLFWLEEEIAPTLSVTRAQSENDKAPVDEGERLLVGQVGGKWVGHALSGDAAFRSELLPADALALPTRKKAASDRWDVQLLDSTDSLARTVLIAGCSPAISLWTRSTQRWHPGLRPTWIHANSTQALEALARGEVHIAGLHLCDPQTGEDNVPFVRELLGSGSVTIINFGVWDEGLMLQSGNPRQIRQLTDLTRETVRFINRESGAGARLLFDTLLKEAKVSSDTVRGYEETVPSHQAVARQVCSGRADAGMGTAAMAQIYGLDFLPLRSVRFDLAVRTEFLKEEPVNQLFETLSHKAVRLQLQKLGGYDTTRAGDVVACV